MTQEKFAKFATFGPNRGLNLTIGNYQFIDGICTVPEADSSSAARVLCRYYDVCAEHDLAEQVKEYDSKYDIPANVGDDSIINKANEEVAQRNSPKKVSAEKAESSKEAEPSKETDSSSSAEATKEESSIKPDKKRSN